MGALMAARRKRFEVWVSDERGALEELGQRMGDGESLQEICKGMDIPQSRVMAWLMGDVKRWEVYQRCLKVQAASPSRDPSGGGFGRCEKRW